MDRDVEAKGPYDYPSWIQPSLSCAFIFCCLLLLGTFFSMLSTSSLFAQEDSFSTDIEVPSKTLFTANFDLGELDQPGVKEIRRAEYVRGFRQIVSTEIPSFMQAVINEKQIGLPEFMERVLAAPAPQGDRYLRLKFLGGDALLVSDPPVSSKQEDGIERSSGQFAPILVNERTRIFLKCKARWDALGEGSWQAILRFDNGDALEVFSGVGAKLKWSDLEASVIVPTGAKSVRLEIWLNGYSAGKSSGELGLDNIQLLEKPRLGLQWSGSIRRIDPVDENPLTVKSFGLPPGQTYQFHLRVIDEAGKEWLVERKPLYVTKNHRIDYTPRLNWRRFAMPRGKYKVIIHVSSPDGWSMERQRGFALAGPPDFNRRLGTTRWGVELNEALKEPDWFSALSPDELLFKINPAKPQVPEWVILKDGMGLSLMLGQEHKWDSKAQENLGPLLTLIDRWFWDLPVFLEQAIPELDSLRALASYLLLGVAYEAGQVESRLLADTYGETLLLPNKKMSRTELLAFTQNPSSLWSMRIEPDSLNEKMQHEELAVMLFAAAKEKARCVYIQNPAGLLLETLTDGGVLPSPSLLTWEFTTAFLSGATYKQSFNWAKNSVLWLFERDGKEYLLCFSLDGVERKLDLYAGQEATVYDCVGGKSTLRGNEIGKISIPLASMPLLISGLDLARVQSLRSVEVDSANLIRDKLEQKLLIRATNFYPDTVRIYFDVKLPADWEAQALLEAKRFAPGKKEEWEIPVRVPPFYGSDGGTELTGDMVIEFADGKKIRTPISRDISVARPLLEVRKLGIGRTDADVVVKNLSAKPMRATVYIYVDPTGTEMTRHNVVFAGGAEQSFRIAYPQASAGRELLVSVSVPSERYFINKSFDIP